MSDTAFTPGPWSVGGEPSLKIWGDYKRTVITEIWHQTSNTTRRANARLIAAAPDLYEALSRLLADVADYPAWQRPCDAYDKAAAALAKARGEVSQ